MCREALILRQRNRLWGSGTAEHPALLDAVLCAVHAGGEQGWESGHLEPLLFCPYLLLRCCSSPIVFAPDWKHNLTNWKNAVDKPWPQFVLKPLPQAGSAMPLRVNREAFANLADADNA